MSKSGKIAIFVADNVSAFGYPLFGVCDDGENLCSNCCRDEFELIDNATYGDGWWLVGYGCAMDSEGLETCAHCNAVIFDPECGEVEDFERDEYN